MKNRALACFYLINTSLLSAATVSWDGEGDGTSWTDAANWAGDVVPAGGDDVVIDIAANPVIQVANALNLRSLNSEEEILFASTLSLTGGTSVIKATTFSDQSIFVSGGASIAFPLLTELSHPTNRDTTLTADGAGSRLSFPNVTTIQGATGLSDDFFFRALNGGRIEIPKATEVTSGAVSFSADGAGSVIDLDDLVSFTGRFSNTASGFSALNGGVLLTPSLSEINTGHITCDSPGNIDLSMATTIIGSGAITLTGGIHDLTALATMSATLQISGGSVPVMTALSDIDGSSIYLTNGAIVNLPLITSYTQISSADRYLQATGVGSQLNFPNLTTLTSNNSTTRQLFIKALEGGIIDLSGVDTVQNPTTNATLLQFIADATDSLIDLSSLIEIEPTDAQIIETNDGVVFTPGLSNSTLPDFNVLSLTPSTTTLIPGAIVSMTWEVGNDGGVDFDGTRQDSIFLASDASASNATPIANFNISGLLTSRNHGIYHPRHHRSKHRFKWRGLSPHPHR